MTSRLAPRWHDVRVQRRAGFFLAATALVVLAGCLAGGDNLRTPRRKETRPAPGPFAEYDRNAPNVPVLAQHLAA
jgi:hypothetical protein